ncbi:putative E3 ubiquitin-protein ligase LIN-1 isoform X2 [Typha latifolia]|uniref:putative E3 ubiquitin-protein ligase LIN-1 isoform X2 n=1 Tax=Typha latifolia TaxID=4733 RepID=UPI003C2F01FF
MALVSTSPPSSCLDQRLGLDAIRALVSIVNHHIHRLLADPVARRSLHLKCRADLAASNHGFFEFSEQSVLSNLYWGVESIEAAIESDSEEDRTSRLVNSEKMLQMPAMLEEDGSTAGIANRYIVCCSYFYLALVRKLRGDQWQMTMHFLQSASIFPRLVRGELAPELMERLFGSPRSRGNEEAMEGEAKKKGLRYKAWLMYYQVVSYGETPPWNKDCSFLHNSDTESCNHLFKHITESGVGNSLLSGSSHFQPDRITCSVGNERRIEEKSKASTSNLEGSEGVAPLKTEQSLLKILDEDFPEENKAIFDIRCLQDMLEESQSDSPVSCYSHVGSMEESDSEVTQKPWQVRIHNEESSAKVIISSKLNDRSASPPESHLVHVDACEANGTHMSSSRSHGSLNNFRYSILDFIDGEQYPSSKHYLKDERPPESSPRHDLRCFSSFSSKFLKKYNFSEIISRGSFARKIIKFSNSEKDWSDRSSNFGKDSQIELLERFGKAVSTLCFPEHPGKCEDAGFEVTTTTWELLNDRTEVKYSFVKQDILDQLLDKISTSKTEKVIRASVSTLLLLISEDRTILEDIKRKDLHLYGLAGALKRNVHEAAILIYLLDPSPSEMKSLELLPALLEVACNSTDQKGAISLPLTPTSASIAMIEVLVTAFDYVTNNMHLAAISSPQILSKLVNIAMNKNLEEGVALAAILVRCMRLNGNCRKFLSQVTPVDPFLHLLRSNKRCAKFAALEYFHEILRMPRSSAIHLLHQIRKQGSISVMHTLTACIQQADAEHRLLAASLLLQLDMLENSNGKSLFREEAIEVLLESVASEENCSIQALGAFILSNLGGTYSWMGESYTAAFLVKKTGLTSISHRNMIRNVEWLDPCLQDSETNKWSSKTARRIIKIGSPVFHALVKGIQSKNKSVSRDCLICIAWLGNEMAVMGLNSLRHSAAEILLSDIARFLHPGSQLDERILACLCVYNFTCGRGKQKLMSFSDGLRESLRRLSAITWMAEELLKVTDYFLHTKPRVSCVHTQILEVGQSGNGAATAITFYKGELYAGYADGTIKAWDIKGQRAMLAREVKGHKRAITCFALFEPGDNLLSGSSDKTIRVWKMAQKKLECIEEIQMKEPVQKLGTCGDKIIAIMKNRALTVSHSSRNIQRICKSKHIKCLSVDKGKFYLGCTDSSVQEVDVIDGTKTEIKAATRSWMQKQSINSIMVHKDWVYCAGSAVEGSSSKDWRKRQGPSITIAMPRGTNVQAMTVVEDFIYLKCNRTPSIIQIWLREKQQKVGRLSAGSKVTSLLAANDIIFCGTESGLVKAWIPL